MAVILLMGSKTNGTWCPKCTKPAGVGGKCCRNTPSFGALLGLERAAVLSKTCFCHSRSFILQTYNTTKTRKWEANPEDYAPLLQRGGELPLKAEVFSLDDSGFK